MCYSWINSCTVWGPPPSRQLAPNGPTELLHVAVIEHVAVADPSKRSRFTPIFFYILPFMHSCACFASSYCNCRHLLISILLPLPKLAIKPPLLASHNPHPFPRSFCYLLSLSLISPSLSLSLCISLSYL